MSNYLPTLKQLQYLVALKEQGHFGKAADSCYVTQSTLSAGIRELESLIGVTLVERTRRVVRFTALGDRIVEKAHRVLRERGIPIEVDQRGRHRIRQMREAAQMVERRGDLGRAPKAMRHHPRHPARIGGAGMDGAGDLLRQRPCLGAGRITRVEMIERRRPFPHGRARGRTTMVDAEATIPCRMALPRQEL